MYDVPGPGSRFIAGEHRRDAKPQGRIRRLEDIPFNDESVVPRRSPNGFYYCVACDTRIAAAPRGPTAAFCSEVHKPARSVQRVQAHTARTKQAVHTTPAPTSTMGATAARATPANKAHRDRTDRSAPDDDWDVVLTRAQAGELLQSLNRLEQAIGRAASHFDEASDHGQWQHTLLMAAKDVDRAVVLHLRPACEEAKRQAVESRE